MKDGVWQVASKHYSWNQHQAIAEIFAHINAKLPQIRRNCVALGEISGEVPRIALPGAQ